MRVTHDQIRKAFDRNEIVTLLELDGFACFDEEPTEELIEALVEHANTEGLDLEALTMATAAA